MSFIEKEVVKNANKDFKDEVTKLVKERSKEIAQITGASSDGRSTTQQLNDIKIKAKKDLAEALSEYATNLEFNCNAIYDKDQDKLYLLPLEGKNNIEEFNKSIKVDKNSSDLNKNSRESYNNTTKEIEKNFDLNLESLLKVVDEGLSEVVNHVDSKRLSTSLIDSKKSLVDFDKSLVTNILKTVAKVLTTIMDAINHVIEKDEKGTYKLQNSTLDFVRAPATRITAELSKDSHTKPIMERVGATTLAVSACISKFDKKHSGKEEMEKNYDSKINKTIENLVDNLDKAIKGLTDRGHQLN